MKSSSKAALQSALIFPGVGHFGLDHYFRGSVLMLSSIVAVSLLVKRMVSSALSAFESVHSGEIIESASIAEMVMITANSTVGFTEKAAGVFLVVCWLVGIIDSYRIGTAQEKIIQTTEANEQN